MINFIIIWKPGFHLSSYWCISFNFSMNVIQKLYFRTLTSVNRLIERNRFINSSVYFVWGYTSVCKDIKWRLWNVYLFLGITRDVFPQIWSFNVFLCVCCYVVSHYTSTKLSFGWHRQMMAFSHNSSLVSRVSKTPGVNLAYFGA